MELTKLAEYGLNTSAVLNFYKEFDAIGGENHSLLITKDNELVYEQYIYPYNAETPHTMFSVTKCIVSLAVGFAISEGLITLDTRILPYFSEYPHKEDPRWDDVTVKALLLMSSNKKFTFLQDMTDDHAKLFMKAKFRRKKGWLYSNNDAHMLAALVEKVSGQHLTEYLEKRLFAPLGITKPFWERNSRGVCVGGSGIYLTARDFQKISLCIANGGKYNDKQIIPADYLAEAITYKIKPAKTYAADGFGYYFWQDQGTYRLEGLMGQFSVVIPEKNTIVTMTAAQESDQLIEKTLQEALIKKLFDPETDDHAAEKLAEYLSERSKSNMPVCAPREPAIEDTTLDSEYKRVGVICNLTEIMPGFPNGFIPNSINSSYARRPKHSFDNFSFRFSKDKVWVRWSEDDNVISFYAGMDGKERISRVNLCGCTYTVWSYAFWSDKKLHVVVRPLNTLATKEYVFDFNQSGMKLKVKCHPDFSIFCGYNSIASGTFPSLPVITPMLVGLLKFGLLPTKMSIRFKKKA